MDKLTKRDEATQTFVPKHEAHATKAFKQCEAADGEKLVALAVARVACIASSEVWELYRRSTATADIPTNICPGRSLRTLRRGLRQDRAGDALVTENMKVVREHQPEAQHPKIFSYPQSAGRLPHLSGVKRTFLRLMPMSVIEHKADILQCPSDVCWGNAGMTRTCRNEGRGTSSG